ncbi:7-cyano-7-deazaguanine synthase QueC [Actinoallomurus sp. NBC_01490]|uniref:7-cyano-7-deazaguanine synthase QueC n=1 Tax=Actinoallomurus sp. NBC_01490 TaxID=2903557 RepID=UPI002E303974|nr:7-cyano-7-deazaguanine synthase QueC [Actinoallomurus sp. NBC_01490]
MKSADKPQSAHAVVVASGGVDSTTLAYRLKAEGRQLTLLGVDYGQRHRTELAYLRRTAGALGARYVQLDLSGLGGLLAGSALTDRGIAVPFGYYTDVSMQATVVPNRNALLLDLAVGLAVSAKADAVTFGAHAGDHPIYPDCRPAFVEAYARMVALANEGFLAEGFEVLAPFLTWTKADIVRHGAELGVPFTDTWSCYRGGSRHCGRCGTCAERREAFDLAGVADPTDYHFIDDQETGLS